MLKEFEGKIAEIIFHNKDNGYTVAVFEISASESEDVEEYFTIVGNIPAAAIGKNYRIQGDFVVNPRYGEQFSVKGFEELMPTTEDGIREFFASGAVKGVGPKVATAIVEAFGKETFEVIENEPEKLLKVTGVGPKVAANIVEAYHSHREFAEVVIDLQKLGISTTMIVKIYNEYGADSVEIIKSNPYCLTGDIFNMGFKKVDEIAKRIGIEEDNENRIISGIKYTLIWFAGEGNTYLPEEELCEKAAQLLEQPREVVRGYLEPMAFAGYIYLDNINGQNVVYLYAYYRAEQNVSKCLRNMTEARLKPIQGDPEILIQRAEEQSGIKLSVQQKQAVMSCLGVGVSVITGGPGTGKTTIINAIINVLEDSELKTAIAAPTGRAAKRITETSGRPASTIHRLLEYSFYEDGGVNDVNRKFMDFGRNEENPLEYDAVIVDEASMIDLMLMNGLISAITPGTRLIIVGDQDQLPSIGAGNVLRDIISSEYVYCTKLTEIFRQAQESMIVVNAHRINHGEYPDCNAKDKDFFLLRRGSEMEMQETIKELCLSRLPKYYKDLVDGELNVTRDIQILTPIRKGNIGCITLNNVLQKALNPPSKSKTEKKYGDKVFREGDKVMQIRNNYEMKWKNHEDFTDGEGVFNGDVGFIENIDNEYNEITVVYDESKYAVYSSNQLDELELAYAITVHKSQGSEFPIVIMPVSWFPPMLATRNLLYTGVTRGKQVVVLVGSENKLNGMVDNNIITQRYSGLDWRLKRFIDYENEFIGNGD